MLWSSEFLNLKRLKKATRTTFRRPRPGGNHSSNPGLFSSIPTRPQGAKHTKMENQLIFVPRVSTPSLSSQRCAVSRSHDSVNHEYKRKIVRCSLVSSSSSSSKHRQTVKDPSHALILTSIHAHQRSYTSAPTYTPTFTHTTIHTQWPLVRNAKELGHPAPPLSAKLLRFLQILVAPLPAMLRPLP